MATIFPTIRPRRAGARRQTGAVLLEALISLGIFAVGILGVLALQGKMVAATSSAKYRADAAYLASEVIGIMWSDVPNLNQYDAATCAGYARCSAWLAKVGSYLPQGGATVAVNNGLVTVTINWTPANAAASTFQTSTAVRL